MLLGETNKGTRGVHLNLTLPNLFLAEKRVEIKCTEPRRIGKVGESSGKEECRKERRKKLVTKLKASL
jgi:hypothetical protein